MSQGNLTNKLVVAGFWPACDNCARKKECETKPRHEAFPHTWHWGRESLALSDGTMLVTASWVGSSVIGETHTGCYDYAVADSQVLPLAEKHTTLILLQSRKRQLDSKLSELERRGASGKGVEKYYTELTDVYSRIEIILGGGYLMRG